MEKTDVIALLYPHGYNCIKAIETIRASPLHVSPRAQDELPYLEIRVGDISRNEREFVFGRHSQCDVVLDYPEISNCHFSLTLDSHNRLMVKDMRSRKGTQVTYNGEGHGVRRDFQWIVGGHQIAHEMRSIIITVNKSISFQIFVRHHPIMCPEYISQVNTFCQDTVTADELGLSNVEPQQARRTHEPDIEAIELSEKIGQGAFGVVTRLWNVSTGSVRVVKEPSASAIKNNEVNYKAWHQEARLMSQISHPHIVRLLESSFDPHPQLYLEYVPLGSLDRYEDISYNETLKIVCQCLLALGYLHDSSPPITHRDIKPGNILVQYRFDSGIYVKLGDFGASKDSSDFTTICGTRKYLAPEMSGEEMLRRAGHEERGRFDTAVDIWSLGMVACELIRGGLPHFGDRYRHEGVAWCERMIQELQSQLETRPNDLGQFILNTMLILLPESRFSARDCYHVAMRLPSADGGSHTSTAASYAEKGKQTTFYEPTVVRPPAPCSPSLQLRPYADANAACPSSAKMSQKSPGVAHETFEAHMRAMIEAQAWDIYTAPQGLMPSLPGVRVRPQQAFGGIIPLPPLGQISVYNDEEMEF